jgi:hypothetical protein
LTFYADDAEGEFQRKGAKKQRCKGSNLTQRRRDVEARREKKTKRRREEGRESERERQGEVRRIPLSLLFFSSFASLPLCAFAPLR